MSITNDTLSSQNLKVFHAAHSLNSTKRQEIGIQAIGGHTPISHVAGRYGVSRKFVYQQKERALGAIAHAFDESASGDSEKVLSRRHGILSRHTRLRHIQGKRS